MQNKFLKFLTLMLLVFFTTTILTGCGGGKKTSNNPPELKTASVVNCTYTEVAPIIDGISDEETWLNVTPVTLAMESIYNVDMRSVYDDSNIYFLFEWIDNDEGLMSSLGEWYKENGNWTWQMKSDGLSLIWDISGITDFNKTGCTTLCHDTSQVLNQRYMAPDSPGAYEELWLWNPGVTGIKGIAASYILENLPEEVNIEDSNFDNKMTAKLLDGDYGFYRNKADNTFEPKENITGDKAPLYIIKNTPASGDAATVKAQGKWEGQRWVLEFSRPRNPENIDLTKFDVNENEWKDFLFSIAIHFNNDRDNHKTMPDGATLRMVGKGVK